MKKLYGLLFAVFFVIGYVCVQTKPAILEESAVDLAASLHLIEVNVSNTTMSYQNSFREDIKYVFPQEDDYTYPGGTLSSIVVIAKDKSKRNSQAIAIVRWQVDNYKRKWQGLEPLLRDPVYIIETPIEIEEPLFLKGIYKT
jgi:hypothetical protein